MSDSFARTPTGTVGKRLFYTVPTIWVEGPTDIFFYLPIVDDLECRIEAFHNSNNAAALIEGLVNEDLPYLIVMDGDYEILSRQKTTHSRIIRLKRYSFENYLWESDPVNRACHSSAQSGDRSDVVGPLLDDLNQHIHDTLLDMVVVDVAARRTDPAPRVLPDRVESLLVDSRRPVICSFKVNDITKAALETIDEKTLEMARRQVLTYLQKRQLVDLLKGHVLFGILRLLFTQAASSIKGKKVIVDDDSLTQLLANATWKRPPSKDHKVLRSKIRKHVGELTRKHAAVK